jgi:uncharacterized metal-binding protein YceD (DUF177 family)
MAEPLAWVHGVAEIPEAGLRADKTATEAERASLAEALEVTGCEEARAEYSIKALGGGRYRMAGKVSARLLQACVVSLEPIETRLSETFDVQFAPPERVSRAGQVEEEEVLGLPEIEPIEHGKIDAGRVVFETLAAAVDPYPRKEGASLDWQDAGDSQAGAPSPFAKLKALKKKP